MARFFAVMSGSAPSLAHHNQLTFPTDIDSGSLRLGLIASRSALSTDIYAELFLENRDGSKGIYFPPDLISQTAVVGQVTASAYTSSRDGIVIPSDFSIRPTASVFSTDPLVTPTVPLNRVSASLVTYQSASKALEDTLKSINPVPPFGFPGGPYSRFGLNSSRTLHSIWHDPDVRYFAWDDFTPGKLQSLAITRTSAPLPPPDTGVYQIITFTANYEFFNDSNPDARIEISASYQADQGTYTLTQLLSPNTPSFSYEWLPAGQVFTSGNPVSVAVTASVRDPIIQTHFGERSSASATFDITEV